MGAASEGGLIEGSWISPIEKSTLQPPDAPNSPERHDAQRNRACTPRNAKGDSYDQQSQPGRCRVEKALRHALINWNKATEGSQGDQNPDESRRNQGPFTPDDDRNGKCGEHTSPGEDR